MDIVRPANATRELGVPQEWDTATQGACSPLPVIDYEEGGSPWMLSVWKPDADDLAALNAGHGITLAILGKAHPVVAVGITNVAITDLPVVP